MQQVQPKQKTKQTKPKLSVLICNMEILKMYLSICQQWEFEVTKYVLGSTKTPVTEEETKAQCDLLVGIALIHYCMSFQNKLPLTGWLDPTEMYFLRVVERTSPKSRWQQGQALQRFWGRILPDLLAAPGGSWHFLPCGHITAASASSSHDPPSVSLASFLIRTYVIGFRVHLDNPELS